ncbi:MAG TPA: low molecular weight protein-tyrosine-phosphatase [Hyphomicrobiales bacterium]|nr:low molecular weight protein-tyrosine-phosphatase [Hyphomicrobiales bacterium]
MTEVHKPIRVLMVCLGNICRSPTAEAALRHRVEQAGLEALIEIDSAGTSDWHQGQQPDTRSIVHAGKRRYDLSGLRARRITPEDFADFDYVLAMDAQNLKDLEAQCPEPLRHKLALYLEEGVAGYREVPDPYQGGAEDFELVLDLCETASEKLLARLRKTHFTDRADD